MFLNRFGGQYMKIGYVRVSTEEQNIERQELIMRELEAERVFIDKMSGKNKERPQLKEMLDFVRYGDTVVVESISRLARNTKDLLDIVEILKSKNIRLVIQKEGVDTSTPVGMCILTIFGAIAQLEREYMLERQREGIAIAKEKGKYAGRKKKQIDIELWNKYYLKWKNKEITATYFIKRAEMCPATFYKLVKQWEQQPKSI